MHFGEFKDLLWRTLHQWACIWVSLILDYLTAGDTIETILKNYPQLVHEDILSCIAYGAAMSHENYVDLDKVA